MRYTNILIFSCVFTLFVAVTAEASGFTGNTCYEAGANCQTWADWLRGWCEAAAETGATDQSAEECAQAVGANDPNNQVVPTPSENSAQNQNRASSNSGSGRSSGGGQGEQRQDRVHKGANDSNVEAKPENGTNCTGADCDSVPDNGSSKGDTQYEKCKSWRVHRSDPTNFICVRPLQRGPFGELPSDYA